MIFAGSNHKHPQEATKTQTLIEEKLAMRSRNYFSYCPLFFHRFPIKPPLDRFVWGCISIYFSGTKLAGMGCPRPMGGMGGMGGGMGGCGMGGAMPSLAMDKLGMAAVFMLPTYFVVPSGKLTKSYWKITIL